MAAGSASMTLAALGRRGRCARSSRRRGQRREHYQAETDFWVATISGVLNERERREISGRRRGRERGRRPPPAPRAAPRPRASGGRAPRPDADFVVDRVQRLGEICRNGETMLDMLLGQLTLDVARFRDVLKVTPRTTTPAAEPAPVRAQRRRR